MEAAGHTPGIPAEEGCRDTHPYNSYWLVVVVLVLPRPRHRFVLVFVAQHPLVRHVTSKPSVAGLAQARFSETDGALDRIFTW